MGGVSIPMHIDPRDRSEEADNRRYALHARMMALNPNGWPKAPTSKKNTNRVAVGVAAQYGKRLSDQISTK